MHIVFVCREYPPTLRGGGIASYIHEMAINLIRRAHSVTVICASDDTRVFSDRKEDGIRVIRLSGGDFILPQIEKSSLIKKMRCLYRFFSYRKKILQQIEQLKDVDIIEVAEYGAEAYYLSKCHVPVVIRLHTPTLLDRSNFNIKKFNIRTFYDYWIGKRELSILSQFKYVTSCSASLKDWFLKYVPDMTGNIEVIYNPIEISKWKTEKIDYVENSILYVGTVMEGKGVGDLIEACRILRERNIPVTLKIVGKWGTYAMKLQGYVTDNHFDWCSFEGNLPREELQNLYSKAKISCFPSWWENMPLVCLEAMLAGNVVIGSRNGGMTEIVTDKKDGFLIEPHAPKDLAECIYKALMMNKNSVTEMKKNALYKIQGKFSFEAVMQFMENYYVSVIKDYKNEKGPLG